MKQPWIVFSHNGEELAAYTYNGTFKGEFKATVQLLAAERGIPAEEIKISIEDRATRR